jgi:hypothetical protein
VARAIEPPPRSARVNPVAMVILKLAFIMPLKSGLVRAVSLGAAMALQSGCEPSAC